MGINIDWEAAASTVLQAGVNYASQWAAEKLGRGSTGSPGGSTSKGSRNGVVGGLTQEQRITWLMGEMGMGPKYTYYEPGAAGGPGALVPVAGGAPIYGPVAGTPAAAAPTVPSYPVPPSWTPITGAPTMETFGTFQPAVATQVSSLPAIISQVPGMEGVGLGAEIYERLAGLVTGQQTMFRATPASARALTTIEARHPTSGKMHYWRHMGTPVLFSGDLANVRRVKKIKSRVNRICGGKR